MGKNAVMIHTFWHFDLALANSDKETCANTFSSNFDGRYLILQAFFTKMQPIPLSGFLMMCSVAK